MNPREETRVAIHDALSAMAPNWLLVEVVWETETPMVSSPIYGALLEYSDAQP